MFLHGGTHGVETPLAAATKGRRPKDGGAPSSFQGRPAGALRAAPCDLCDEDGWVLGTDGKQVLDHKAMKSGATTGSPTTRKTTKTRTTKKTSSLLVLCL